MGPPLQATIKIISSLHLFHNPSFHCFHLLPNIFPFLRLRFPLHLLIGDWSREYYYPEALCAQHAEERGRLRMK